MSVADGTSSSWVVSKLADTPVVFTSTTGDSPVTVTVSATVAMSIMAFTLEGRTTNHDDLLEDDGLEAAEFEGQVVAARRQAARTGRNRPRRWSRTRGSDELFGLQGDRHSGEDEALGVVRGALETSVDLLGQGPALGHATSSVKRMSFLMGSGTPLERYSESEMAAARPDSKKQGAADRGFGRR